MRLAALLRNWPLKLTSLFLAVVLWLLAAGEEPASRLVAAELQVRPPAGRVLAQPLAPVTVAVVGPRRELLKLGASRVILTRLLPDTVTADSVTMVLGTATFACDGKKFEQDQGSFNYLPAKMEHEGWLSAGSLTFITVDGAWDVNWVDGPPTAKDLIK